MKTISSSLKRASYSLGDRFVVLDNDWQGIGADGLIVDGTIIEIIGVEETYFEGICLGWDYEKDAPLVHQEGEWVYYSLRHIDFVGLQTKEAFGQLVNISVSQKELSFSLEKGVLQRVE